MYRSHATHTYKKKVLVYKIYDDDDDNGPYYSIETISYVHIIHQRVRSRDLLYTLIFLLYTISYITHSTLDLTLLFDTDVV